MLFTRGHTPLAYRRLARSQHGEIARLSLDPSQVERFLGPLTDILAALRRGPAHALFTIDAAGELVGFYVVHPDARDRSCWWLGWLALDRRQQGRGYGRCALQDILARLRRIVGCRRVRLLVSADNMPAQSLYGCAGFVRVGQDAGTRELVLELGLGSVCCNIGAKAHSLARAVAGAFRTFRHRRLRMIAGPHAAWTIGVERGPPTAHRTGRVALKMRVWLCRPFPNAVSRTACQIPC